ncbi:PREDICTED: transcriptional elongation regulator MINIYO [Prunus mume]|uniref:Transcriptional elongation regulator MINIYO n=1 Tax=Prunus mume TaxID=102107 RepID=A0ABM0P916_PRUMU|nr:PREDICTED: transcriptional elongation regulator MINIYO [Prunus mume]
MEKKQSSKASSPGEMKRKTKVIVGTDALQLSEGDASSLIGGIVEKGISDKSMLGPTPPPRPTVLPFPVARHRSALPYRNPVNRNLGGNEGVDYGDGGDDVMNFEPIKPYANPVERKKKKEMDFSKWAEKELGVNRTRTVRETMEASTRKNGSNKLHPQPKPLLGNLKTEQESVLGNLTEQEFLLGKNDMKIQAGPSPKSLADNVENEQVSMSLETQIDEENRARLQGMSADEIAEAQAEIMGRLDPALLNVLKRRGEEKLRKQRSPRSDNNEPKFSPSSESGMSHVDTTITSNHTKTAEENGLEQNSGQASGSLWTAWRERVEAARELRFSLDGTVIFNGFHQIPKSSNVSERDFLRTEGDPGAAGYTIKEAVSLTRSVIPGQRSLSLHLLSTVLDKALQNIHQMQVQFDGRDANKVDKSIDWEAVWAYALGPEPELILSLRLCLDDNHSSVVLACAKVLHCILSYDVNENFFDISEKIATRHKDTFTAPVFRSKPEIAVGFLRGGFWKYNAKPSNILALDEEIIDDETEGKRTIQDDVVVAGQDFAAGLVRMGILPRLRYLLESDPTAALEEYIISLLIAIARHSPKCANAVMNCQRLIQTVVSRFIAKESVEIQPSKIKSVRLLKVLAQSDGRNCVDFIKNGSFQTMTWHLYQSISFLDKWVKSGKENCQLSSALMVEQLRFWKVCIQHGHCVSYFSDIFPNLCIWLNPPIIEKLIENDVLSEFASITTEGYLVLEALARRLPSLFSQKNLRNQISEYSDDDTELWSWSHVGPMVDIALKWIVMKSDPSICNLFEKENGVGVLLVSQDLSVTSLLWVYSAVMHMLSRVLEKVIPDDTVHLHESGSLVPWLPEFVPKVGLEIIKNGFMDLSDTNDAKYGKDPHGSGSFIEKLCHLRSQGTFETSLPSVCCLQGLVGIIISIDKLIMLARTGVQTPSQNYTSTREEKILKDGILGGCLVELRSVQNTFMKLVASDWHLVQSIEMFGRGGPSPGVGVGWGASGGGYWSATFLLSQADSRFLIDLLEIWKIVSNFDIPTEEEMTLTMLVINSSLGVCVTAGPTDGTSVKKAINILLDVSVLKYLDLCIRRFLFSNKGVKVFDWEYKEEDYQLFSETLASHFNNRWLSVKKKLKDSNGNNLSGSKPLKNGKGSLDTIYEDLDTSHMISQDCSSLVVEWAHQRLPLPISWFLSPTSTLCDSKQAGLKKSSNLQDLIQDPGDFLVVSQAGLFFLLGIEALSSFLPDDIPSPVKSVSLVWKLHSLSMILLVGMGVIEDERSRAVYEALQDLYGNFLHQATLCNLLTEPRNENNLEFLAFQSEIHETYSTFIETLVEQFSAISYGDLVYGRQVAVYLHRCVEAPVRLATWNTLTNSRVLELLPPLENCFTDAEGYLEPVEDNFGILEAYAKAWTSGALDRAASRGSLAYTLVLHHLSAFIFNLCTGDKLLLRNKLSRSLLLDFSLKQQHEAMMLNLIQYNKPSTSHRIKQEDGSPAWNAIEKRLALLNEACETNSSLLAAVEKLRSSLTNKML